VCEGIPFKIRESMFKQIKIIGPDLEIQYIFDLAQLYILFLSLGIVLSLNIYGEYLALVTLLFRDIHFDQTSATKMDVNNRLFVL
jgi:hypothetical protein